MSSDATGIHKLEDVVDLGKFLQARRARVNPAEVGLPDNDRRRVPGLRREELALLAGVSVDYYTRLEQGRAKHPSDQVLDAVARALRLDETTRSHLHRLAGNSRLSPLHASAGVRPSLQTMLAAIDGFPALIMNHRQDVLASNRLARLLYGGFGWDLEANPNFVRLLFEEDSQQHFPDWEAVCSHETVAQLRKMAALFPEDKEMTALIGDLTVEHRFFAELWAQAEVKDCNIGWVRFEHPMVGLLQLYKDQFRVADGSGQMLVTLTAAPGTDDYDKLALLGADR
ncbi:helix-turn-helix transcriptional regulator [Glycomyces sp. TRM65418]|uniref:helix-turn-helix transcriptional regulator n=1 Tax=Glycomyces sp. TRM65418 TaxID=2867006 RepID=UPI001CE66C4D|nr:helix-turn-helix transcriptional regulator [Glycomyces sp. TRM65418]MCC3765227.1 helix-turn-helix transcriptional regulator [Glycomyces sp. TRM65418]QZD54851.1 helix-turn-helix transcriptional regulator [Glycomyces sp. TRM65418]